MDTKKIKEILKKKVEEVSPPPGLPPFFFFENEGDELFGRVLGIRSIETRFGKRLAVDVEREDGDVVTLLVVHQTLVNLWKEADPKEGDWIYIVYDGMRESGFGRKYHVYRLAKMDRKEAEKYMGEKVEVKVSEREKKIRMDEDYVKACMRRLMRTMRGKVSVAYFRYYMYEYYGVPEDMYPLEKLLELGNLKVENDMVIEVGSEEETVQGES